MKNVLKITLLFLSLTIFVQAQEKPKAELFSGFNAVNECLIGAYIDNFFVTLQNNPKSNGTIIVYQGRDILPADYDSPTHIRFYQTYPKFRGFDLKRITIIDGGFREERATELWLVPEGATPPKPTNTIPKPTIPKNKTFLYDRNYLDLYFGQYEKPSVLEENSKDDDGEPFEPIDFNEILSKEDQEEIKFSWVSESFGNFLKQNKEFQGVIVFYGDKDYYDIDKITLLMEEGSKILTKETKIPASKIQVFYGGYRSMIEIEFWIMNKNSGFPEIKPEKKEDEHSTNE